MKKRTTLVSLLLAAALALGGCGGGGGGGEGPDPITSPPPPPPPPPPPSQDTDGDGLSDADENSIGTSPILADTDGDGLSDGEEVTSGGFNPLIADIPKVSISVIDDPTIQLNVFESDGVTAVGQYTAAYARGQTSSYARSDTTATSTTIESSTRVYTESEAQAGIGGIGGSSKVGAEASVSAAATQENSTSVTQTSAQESRQEFSRFQSDTRNTSNTVESGSLSTTLEIRNISNLSFELANVEVIAKKRSRSGSFQPVGTLRFDNGGTPRELGNGESVQGIVDTDTPSVPLLKELMENPSGLLFSVSDYDLNKVGNEDGRSFARISQDVSAQTAQVVIDYGDNTYDGNNSVEQYMVATNVDRDSATNEPLGITMDRVMSEILGISYQVTSQAVLDDNNQDTGQTREVVSQVRSLANQSIRDGFWYVYSNSDSLENPETDFDDIVLRARDRITIVYLADADEDRLFNREEFLIGTALDNADSDGDQVSDFDEVRNGWTVTVDGAISRVTSDPLNSDVDGDTLSDLEERNLGTNPNNADTDGDGERDNVDPNPTGFSRLGINFELAGPTQSVTGTGLVTPAGETLIEVEIDWGDGTVPSTFPKQNGLDEIVISAFHDYVNPGDYEVVLTARSVGNPDEVRRYPISFTGRFVGDIGCCSFDAGFSEAIDDRLIADINGDGLVDILAFGETGTWRALSNGTGFDAAEQISTDFASGTTFNKDVQRRELANVGGNPAPDIVMFDTDGVYVALNDGSGNFGAATRWIENYGVDQGYLDFAVYPRVLGEANGDSFADIFGYSADGVVIGVSNGNSAFTTPFATVGTMGLNIGGWDADNPRVVGDINGDGLSELIGFGAAKTFIKVNEGNGTFSDSQSYPYMTTAQGYRVSRHPRFVADINADGFDDLLTYANAGTYQALSNGSEMDGALSQLSTAFGYDDGYRLGNDERVLADINGDGFLDIVGFGPERTNVPGGVYYILNTDNGGSFGPRVKWLDEFATGLGNGYNNADNPRLAGDVNGDGFDDLIIFDDSEVIVVFSAATR
ncbi:MAG: FG-GAP-like repeat-containing protein [Woeseiaceae bacterium]|nr:FG-GAP-like repeat-containing protein [Woeseiaceae bacterium]